MDISRDSAIKLLLEYNKEVFHIRHAITVGEIMSWYAEKYNYDTDYWGVVGLLHDLDYELYPDDHCQKTEEILSSFNYPQSIIKSIYSHGYGICTDIEPEHFMEKILYSIDELSGIIFAMVLIRPSHSTKDITLTSLKKKFKDKTFAARCSRNVIKNGALMLGWDVEKLLDQTLKALQEKEIDIEQIMLSIEK